MGHRQGLGLGGQHGHVAGAPSDHLQRPGHGGLLGLGHPLHHLDRVGSLFSGGLGEEHVEVGGDEPIAVGLGHAPRYQRPPIAPLHDVAVVAQLLHDPGDGLGAAVHVHAGVGGRTGEAVAGKRRDHHVEGIGRITAVGGRVGQRAHHLAELHHRAHVAVDHHHGQRVGLGRANMVEVHPLAGRSRGELGKGVEIGLSGPPVVAVGPVLAEIPHVGHVGAVVPPRPHGVGPSGHGQTPVQVV